MELKAARGKTVKRLAVVKDVDLDAVEFTDGTFLQIDANPSVQIKARFLDNEVQPK